MIDQQQESSDSNGINLKIDNLSLLLSAVRATVSKLERDVAIVKKTVRIINGGAKHSPPFALVPSREETHDACSVHDLNESSVRKVRKNFYAFCELDADDDAGWIVIQRRFDGSFDFFKGWNEYKNGFGNIAGEFWMGLDKIHELTSSKLHELKIVMEDFEGVTRFARYSAFAIDSEATFYTLSLLGKYFGDAEDSLSYHAGMKFSTFE